jgi:class 3 adenylate cyclase
MDAAMREHHRIMRKLLKKHHGYESVTEGDSFTLAFHNATEAVMFAIEAQEALMQGVWPPELLNTSLCKPVWVKPL